MVKKLTMLGVLEPFLSRPKEELHLAEISRMINEPHPTTRQWLNSLQKKGILVKGTKGRLTTYKLNVDNYTLLNYLIISEKNKLIKKCEKSLLLNELVNQLSEHVDNKNFCVIFGSASENFDTANDVDLLIIGKRQETKLKEIASRLNKEIHIINLQSLDKISKSLKEEIVKKHLIIKGSETILRWMIWQK